MTALYNENEPFAATWLERLSQHDQIPQGRVDRRSIADLTPADVAGPGQRHFFAGIGGWALACRLAGLPDHADIWTGSCPCQGLSDAGQRRGFLDPRHLWPAWLPLIEKCRPPVIFGEQVASALGLGWLDLVCADLERCGYAVGASDLCAASVGAPHQRQRLFFVAYADGEPGRLLLRAWRSRQQDAQARRSGEAGELADAHGGGRDRGPGHVPPRREQPDALGSGAARGMGDTRRTGGRRNTRGVPGAEAQPPRPGDPDRGIGDLAVDAGQDDCACWNRDCMHRQFGYALARGMRYADGSISDGQGGRMADPGRVGGGSPQPSRPERPDSTERRQGSLHDQPRSGDVRTVANTASRRRRKGDDAPQARKKRGARSADGRGMGDAISPGLEVLGEQSARREQPTVERAGAPRDFWSPCDWIHCSDGVSRPVEPGTHPLVAGLPGRVGLLRGYGNAIVPQVAAEFIIASLEALADMYL